MTTLNVTDSTADLIETLTIAVAAVGILDDETRRKHGPRMARLLAAVRGSATSELTATCWSDGLPCTRRESSASDCVPLAEQLAQVEHMHDDAERRVDELNAEVARLWDQGSR